MKTRSSKFFVAAAALCTLICAAVRSFQIISLTDLDTGYFFKGAEVGGLLVYILLAVSAIALTVLAFLGKKRGDAAYYLSSDGMGDNATRILGISEIVGAVLIGFRLTEGDTVIVMVLNIAAAAGLLVSGFALIGRVIPPVFTGHVKLVAALYLFFRTANFFNADLIVLNHAENLIILIGYICATAFMAALARFYARLETRNSRIAEVIFALLTFLTCATHTVSDLVGLVCGGSTAEFVAISPDIAAMALISGTYLAVLFCTEKKKDLVPLIESD